MWKSVLLSASPVVRLANRVEPPAAFPFAVEEQLTGRAVVDDAVLGVGRGRADVERIGTQHADGTDPGEDRIVEPDRVDTDRHVGDGVDVGRGVQRGVEQELVVRRHRR